MCVTVHVLHWWVLQNYRDVLKDYRLFHLVVMNRDKRSLLVIIIVFIIINLKCILLFLIL